LLRLKVGKRVTGWQPANKLEDKKYYSTGTPAACSYLKQGGLLTIELLGGKNTRQE